jgi:hypothetical protein
LALFFSIDTLEEQCGSNTTLFLYMLYYHWNKAVPLRNSNIKYRSKVPLVGHSFLLNPSDFFKDQCTDPIHKVQYIKLAGRRDYSLFKQYKYLGLQTSFFPDLVVDNIKHNPLLEINKTEILFKYEK